jgi:hypothetical protein
MPESAPMALHMSAPHAPTFGVPYDPYSATMPVAPGGFVTPMGVGFGVAHPGFGAQPMWVYSGGPTEPSPRGSSAMSDADDVDDVDGDGDDGCDGDASASDDGGSRRLQSPRRRRSRHVEVLASPSERTRARDAMVSEVAQLDRRVDAADALLRTDVEASHTLQAVFCVAPLGLRMKVWPAKCRARVCLCLFIVIDVVVLSR